jgi:hypothetical protein
MTLQTLNNIRELAQQLRDDPANDHLIFSKGHTSPLLYSMFKAAGVISDEKLINGYRRFGSVLQGHPTPVLPWIDVAAGSLGQGLPDGVGVVLAGRYLDELPLPARRPTTRRMGGPRRRSQPRTLLCSGEKHAPTSALVLGVADVRHPGITDRCGSARATPATFVRPTSRHWQLERAVVSQVSPVKAQRARDNRAIVRKLLRQRQPEFAAALASAEHYFSCPCGRAGRRDRRDDRAQDLPS